MCVDDDCDVSGSGQTCQQREFDPNNEEFELIAETDLLPRDAITNGETQLPAGQSCGTYTRPFEECTCKGVMLCVFVCVCVCLCVCVCMFFFWFFFFLSLSLCVSECVCVCVCVSECACVCVSVCVCVCVCVSVCVCGCVLASVLVPSCFLWPCARETRHQSTLTK